MALENILIYRKIGEKQGNTSVLRGADGKVFSPETERYKKIFNEKYFPERSTFNFIFNISRGNGEYLVPALLEDGERFYSALSPNDLLLDLVVLHAAQYSEDGVDRLRIVITHYDGNGDGKVIGEIEAERSIEGKLTVPTSSYLNPVDDVTTPDIQTRILKSLAILAKGFENEINSVEIKRRTKGETVLSRARYDHSKTRYGLEIVLN